MQDCIFQNSTTGRRIPSTSPKKEESFVQMFYEELGPIVAKIRKKVKNPEKTLGIDRSTLWRWENKLNRKFPDPNKLMRVLSEHSGLTSKFEVAKYYKGRISNFIHKSFPVQVREEQKEFKSFSLLKDQYDFVVFYICSTERGATEDELMYLLGNMAMKKAEVPAALITDKLIYDYGQIVKPKVDFLENLEIIKKDDDGFFRATDSSVMDYDFDEIGDNIMDCLKDFIKSSDFGKGSNASYTFQESVPLDVAIEVALDTRLSFQNSMDKMVKNKTKDKNSVPYMISYHAERLWFDKVGADDKKIEKGGVQ